MIEYRVEITDSKGQSVKILLHLSVAGASGGVWKTSANAYTGTTTVNAGTLGIWRTLDKGFFAFDGGVVDVGNYPTNSLAWVAMYGGVVVDDNKLVFHLDDFLTHTHAATSEGKGVVYKQDYILMEPGEVSWRLLP